MVCAPSHLSLMRRVDLAQTLTRVPHYVGRIAVLVAGGRRVIHAQVMSEFVRIDIRRVAVQDPRLAGVAADRTEAGPAAGVGARQDVDLAIVGTEINSDRLRGVFHRLRPRERVTRIGTPVIDGIRSRHGAGEPDLSQ